MSSSAHQWAREFAKFGHTGHPMAPKFIRPYRMISKPGKNDAADADADADADAIGEAVMLQRGDAFKLPA